MLAYDFDEQQLIIIITAVYRNNNHFYQSAWRNTAECIVWRDQHLLIKKLWYDQLKLIRIMIKKTSFMIVPFCSI